MDWTSDLLDYFVKRSDELGGPNSPGCTGFWHGFNYVPTYQVDQSLDPFSEAYVAEQVMIYEELAGHAYNIASDERTSFDLPRHVAAVNPYDHPDPSALAMHLQRLSRALRLARLQRGERLLDMGCGWGLSSELGAYLGLEVTAVDINPDFVQLVNERAKRGGRAIKAVTSTFEAYAPDEPVDVALFYECLHHAVRPWTVVGVLSQSMRDGSRIVLTGEPINNHWWTNWGMRLDPISVYCIRKFGWFESGWSLDFIRQVLHRAGLVPQTYLDSDPEVGFTIIGEKKAQHLVPASLCAELFGAFGFILDGNWLIFGGEGGMRLSFPNGSIGATLNISSFRSRPLRLLATSDGRTIFEGNLQPGETQIRIPRLNDIAEIRFDVERWIPDDELQNGDRRLLGMHLQNVSF